MTEEPWPSSLIEPDEPRETPEVLDKQSTHMTSLTAVTVDQEKSVDDSEKNSVIQTAQSFDQYIHDVAGEDALMQEESVGEENLHDPFPIVERNYIRAFVPGTDATVEHWDLQRLVFGDESVSQSGHKLEDGKWYGSTEVNGDKDTFVEVDIDSLTLASCGQTVVTWSKGVLKNGSRRRAPDERPIAVLRYTPQDEINAHLVRAVKLWLTKYRGAVLYIGGPSTRTTIANIAHEFVHEFGFVLQSGRVGHCVLDSILNSVDRVAGRTVALKVADKINKFCLHFTDLGYVPKVVQDLKAGVNAMQIEIVEENKFKWLVHKAEGTYIVRLEQRSVVDYVIVVDTCARIIVDSAEQFPIRLTEETLRKSGGDIADKLRVKEVIQVVKHAAA